MAYDAETGTATYISSKADGPTAGQHTFEATAFIARLVAHIPVKGQVLQRCDGYYANRTRGERRKVEPADPRQRHKWGTSAGGRRLFRPCQGQQLLDKPIAVCSDIRLRDGIDEHEPTWVGRHASEHVG